MDTKEALSIFLPKDTLKYFDITDAKTTDDEVHIHLTEKNIPPNHGSKIKPIFKGYKSIMVSDFPIRGKRAIFTFRRRYWQIPGENKMLTSDIPLVFPGTKIEHAFADFLKDRGGDNTDILGEYSDFIPHTDKRI